MTHSKYIRHRTEWNAIFCNEMPFTDVCFFDHKWRAKSLLSHKYKARMLSWPLLFISYKLAGWHEVWNVMNQGEIKGSGVAAYLPHLPTPPPSTELSSFISINNGVVPLLMSSNWLQLQAHLLLAKSLLSQRLNQKNKNFCAFWAALNRTTLFFSVFAQNIHQSRNLNLTLNWLHLSFVMP